MTSRRRKPQPNNQGAIRIAPSAAIPGLILVSFPGGGVQPVTNTAEASGLAKEWVKRDAKSKGNIDKFNVAKIEWLGGLRPPPEA